LIHPQFTAHLLAARYPEDAGAVWCHLTDFGFRADGDLDIISEPLDFLGVNYYFRVHVRAAPTGTPPGETAFDIGVQRVTPEGLARTGLGWPIEPDGLYETLTGVLRDRYQGLPPIYITENGCSYPDEVGVPDEPRIAFLQSHLAAAARAIADGVGLRGYFHWSLIDNFEWARGYAPRFGLVHIDYATQVRTPKASYAWFRDFLAT